MRTFPETENLHSASSPDMTAAVIIVCALGYLRVVIQAADVIQDPTFIVSSPMKNISVTCKHNDSNKYTKSWYRQEKTKGLILMGYTNYEGKASMEPGFTDSRIEMKPESSQKSILTITEVSAQDTAVYFCASSASSALTGTNTVAYFGAGTVLSILEEGKEPKKPNVSIYRPNKQELKDRNFISLVCVASDFFPEHVKIKWFVNSVERNNVYEPTPQKNGNNFYSTSKRLTLTREEYFNPDSTFRCVAAFLDGSLEASEEIKGETDCGVSKEFYTMYINQGKISYIMILCKSGLYALVVLVLVWRKKVIAHSY